MSNEVDLDKLGEMVKEITNDFNDENNAGNVDVDPVEDSQDMETGNAESATESPVNEVEKVEVQSEEAQEEDAVAKNEALDDFGNPIAVEEDQSQTDTSEKYVPNFKYSVKGEEKEFPEFIRGSIVSAESEAMIRDMLTKVDGIDGIKEGREKAIAEAQEYASKYQSADKRNKMHDEYYNSLNNLVGSKDWDNFYKHAGISETDILDYAEELLRRKELPVDQQAAIKQNAESRMQATYQSKIKDDVLAENNELQQRLDRMEIDSVFGRTDISEAEKAFDERMGAAGSFRRAVGEIGNAYWNTENRMSVLEACQEAIKRYGISPSISTANPQTAPKESTPVAGMAKKIVVRNVNHIPSIKHNASQTPVKRVVKDVDDMFREAEDYLSKL